MAEILDFNQRRMQKEIEELDRDLQSADELIEDLTDELAEMFDAYGMSERNEQIAKDFFYIYEAIRSFVYGYYEIEHPFHSVIDKMVDVSHNNETNTYNVYWKEKPTDEGHIEEILDLSDIIE